VIVFLVIDIILKKCTNEDKKGKVHTYFTFKEHFIREKYTFLNDFKVRQAICKIRISAHPLMEKIFQYHKSCFSFLVSRHSMQFPKILIIERSSLVNK
jgi:hypothetical protein